ncbi:MAG: GNAT family N-acetyltransferase [Flavobacterium psychrophilum]|jgi:ribosomal-protein-alanine N-acetyltransferase
MLFELETKRLLLRPFLTADAEVLFKMDANPNVHRYLWQKPTQNLDESRVLIEYIHKQYAENKIGRFATILKDTNEFIGWTGIKYVNDHTENGNTNFYDYGYRLDEPHWGKGYATEATIAWLDHGFSQMQIPVMHAYTHHDNGASNHILSKVGMELIENYIAADGVKWNWWKLENKK